MQLLLMALEDLLAVLRLAEGCWDDPGQRVAVAPLGQLDQSPSPALVWVLVPSA